MNSKLSRRSLLALSAVLCGFLTFSCAAQGGGGAGASAASSGAGSWEGKTVYSRVGMKVEPNKKGDGWHMYSTNHIGLQKHIPAGTKFTARSVGRSTIDLAADDNSVIHVEFVARHHADMNFAGWLERQLSATPVELPGNLNDKERAAIQGGTYEVGMSREALFLSIGYPPTALSPSLNDPSLKYEVKRFNNIVFSFDADNRVSAIQN